MDSLILTDLTIHTGQRPLLSGVSLTLHAGELLALVGDSGSGKSLTARALLGILPPGLTVQGQLEVTLRGVQHRPLQQSFKGIRGALSYLPQDASSALDPRWTVQRHLKAVSPQGEDPAPWLKRAGFSDPEAVRRLYPHELSGGMAQRVCIAIALAQRARFLIADEPTTGLDTPIQRGFLRQLRQLREEGMGILLITHDIGILPGLADRILRMQEGVLRALSSDALVSMQAQLQLDGVRTPLRRGAPVVTIDVDTHRYRRGLLSVGPRVLDRTALTVHQGEVVGLIGESGSGKTTLARAAAGLLTPTAGTVCLFETTLTPRTPLRPLRRRLQVLFQSADAHLNPGMSLSSMLRHSARLHRPDSPAGEVAAAALERVGLGGRGAAYPRHLSGGERRRFGLARVLIAQPRLLISDEPTTGLDAAKRADLLELLLSSAESHLIISHDLKLIAYAADRIVVMLAGRIIEVLPAAALSQARHPYTLLLLGSSDASEARALQACPQPSACSHARLSGGRVIPRRLDIGPDHWVACYRTGES
ncbi:MAG: ATP-binding cassette domain-containing protein [Myxococcota bacterium]|nr:ATP-binding cassette domain-containing protein [Myxococcota bacterium]